MLSNIITAPGCGLAVFSGAAAVETYGHKTRAVEVARLGLASAAIAATVVAFHGAGHAWFTTKMAIDHARDGYAEALRNDDWNAAEITEFLADPNKAPEAGYVDARDLRTTETLRAA